MGYALHPVGLGPTDDVHIFINYHRVNHYPLLRQLSLYSVYLVDPLILEQINGLNNGKR